MRCRLFDWISKRLRGANETTGARAVHAASGASETASARGYTIENAWRDHLAPELRALGFKGSGRHYIRMVDGFAMTVSLQGSMGGGQFAVNLGLQPLAIPDASGKRGDGKALREIDCVFRTRLSPDRNDMWWAYDDSAESRIDAARVAAKLFRDHAMALFEERIAFFNTVSPAHLDQTTPVTCMTLALLREAQGNEEQARAFARLARDNARPGWVALRRVEHLLD